MADLEILRSIALRVLNETGQDAVEALIEDEKLVAAEAYVLGGIDSCFQKEIISYSEATTLYTNLGVDPEKASRLRQQHVTTS